MEDFGDKKVKSGSFQALGLDRNILNGLSRMGYKAPTPVQRKALPLALSGIDLVCMARTGSGKTCAFLVPMIQKLLSHSSSGTRGIVLSPTRELAVQTFKFARDVAKFTDLNIVNILGGDPMEKQFEALASKPDVIIATPGRLMHHLREIKTFKLNNVQVLIFDEADRLFEMGFAEQLNEIVRECPTERQTLLFSATMPKALVQFSRAGLRDPQLVRLDADSQLSDELRLAFFAVRSNEKIAAFLYLVRKIIPDDQMTIVFTCTRHHSEMIHSLLESIKVSSTVVYGSMDQEARSAHLKAFRNGSIRYLIVTDLAARGIDVPLLNNVINFHFPPSPKLFVHRCGRAARQGRIGYAFSLVEPEEYAFMADVHQYVGKEIDMGVSNEDSEAENVVYNLQSMRPHHVHTGLLPQDVLDQENDFFKRLVAQDDTFSTLVRISNNGMEQYRRTRTEATRSGVKIAKMLLKDNRISTFHPLIKGCDPVNCNDTVMKKNEFVKMLQTFRPAQTVFETGIGTGCLSLFSNSANNLSGVTNANKKAIQKGTDMMKELRASNSQSLERNRRAVATALMEEKEAEANEKAGIDWDTLAAEHDDGLAPTTVDEYGEEQQSGAEEEGDARGQGKLRLSVAERRKLKKQGKSQEEIHQHLIKRQQKMEDQLDGVGIEEGADGRTSKKRKLNSAAYADGGSLSSGLSEEYKDSRHYMSYGDEDSRASFAEEVLQPQAHLRSSESLSAMKMEQALLDLDPDDAMALNNKKRVMRWDAKKRKFVKQTLQEMAESQKRGPKRLRSETGVSSRKSTAKEGELYEKWKKRTRREVGGDGGDEDLGAMPNMKVNRNAKDEVLSLNEIRKSKKEKDNMRIKNMSKDKRTKMEAENRKKKKLSQERYGFKKANMVGSNRRSKILVRM